jgi:hypothetical protein
MINLRPLLSSLVLSLMLGLSGLVSAAEATNAVQMIAEAEVMNKAAGEIGYEWRDTASYIADAKKALADGKESEAYQLANEAFEQAKLALAQGMLMKKNWQQYIPL